MKNMREYIRYLTVKGKKQDYIDAVVDLLESFFAALESRLPDARAVDGFVRSRWSGYVSRDRATYQILCDYADYCAKDWPVFSNAFNEHVRETFEGEARKAVKAYRNAIVPIPPRTKIDPGFLCGMTNDGFVKAFRSLQDFICAVYEDIANGSPFEWGWPGWNAITAEGLNQNRVMALLEALACGVRIDGGTLTIDKKLFGAYGITKPFAKIKMMLDKLTDKGLRIEGLGNKNSPAFTVSYPNAPNMIKVLYAYFNNERKNFSGGCKEDSRKKSAEKNHVRAFSYRFVEDPETQTRETFFLAKTDGEPEKLREIHYWLYGEALRHGYIPMGYENMGCYVYKKGKSEWLLLGSGSSYHEDEFLHVPGYALAAKSRFYHIFLTHPEKMDELRKGFPESFGRPWTQCFNCKAKPGECKYRVSFEKYGLDYNHCGARSYLYFHDPDFEDVKKIIELFKLENNIL